MFIFQVTTGKEEKKFGKQLTSFEEKLDALTDLFPPTAIAKSSPPYVAIENIKKGIKELKGDYKDENAWEKIERKIEDLSDAVNGFNPVYRMAKGTTKSLKNDVNDAVYYYNQYIGTEKPKEEEKETHTTNTQWTDSKYKESGFVAPNPFKDASGKEKVFKYDEKGNLVPKTKEDSEMGPRQKDGTFTNAESKKNQEGIKSAIKMLKDQKKIAQDLLKMATTAQQRNEINRKITSIDSEITKREGELKTYKTITQVNQHKKSEKTHKQKTYSTEKFINHETGKEDEITVTPTKANLFGDTPMEHMYKFISENPAMLDYFDKEIAGDRYGKFLDYFGATEETANEENLNDFLAEIEKGNSIEDKIANARKYLEASVFGEKFSGSKYTGYRKEGSYYGSEPTKVEDKRKKDKGIISKDDLERMTKDTQKELEGKKEQKKTEETQGADLSAFTIELTSNQQAEFSKADWKAFGDIFLSEDVQSALGKYGENRSSLTTAYLSQALDADAYLYFNGSDRKKDKVASMISGIDATATLNGWTTAPNKENTAPNKKEKKTAPKEEEASLSLSTGTWVDKFSSDREVVAAYLQVPESRREEFLSKFREICSSAGNTFTEKDGAEGVVMIMNVAKDEMGIQH